MDIGTALISLFAIGLVGYVIYLANVVKARPESEALRAAGNLRVLLIVLIGLTFLSSLSLLSALAVENVPEVEGLPSNVDVDPATAVFSFVFISASCVLAYRVLSSETTREQIGNLLGSTQAKITYDPQSPVHMTAIVLAMTLFSFTLSNFVLSGGLSGLAASLEESGISIFEAVFQGVLQVAAAFLGIGLGIRRFLPDALSRLGLLVPATSDIWRGIWMGLGLIGILIVYGVILDFLIPSEQLEQQTEAAQQLALSFATLPLALIVSTSAAVSEEIFYRGALQPVFGVCPTSIFFTLMHVQVLLTPGMIIIFIVSLGLGWVRKRYNTTTAIVAHFAYNFLQLALLTLALSSGAV